MVAATLFALPALAQTKPTDLSVPMFAASADPLALTPAPNQSGPAGTLTMAPAAPAPAYSFDEFRQSVHGYVAAGLGTHNGAGVEGGVVIPLVPGRAELALSAGTGQFGLPKLGGGKRVTVGYDSYSGTLDLHPTDDFNASISFVGLNLHPPRQSP